MVDVAAAPAAAEEAVVAAADTTAAVAVAVAGTVAPGTENFITTDHTDSLELEKRRLR